MCVYRSYRISVGLGSENKNAEGTQVLHHKIMNYLSFFRFSFFCFVLVETLPQAWPLDDVLD